jgi:hypothetical protein
VARVRVSVARVRVHVAKEWVPVGAQVHAAPGWVPVGVQVPADRVRVRTHRIRVRTRVRANNRQAWRYGRRRRLGLERRPPPMAFERVRCGVRRSLGQCLLWVSDSAFCDGRR